MPLKRNYDRQSRIEQPIPIISLVEDDDSDNNDRIVRRSNGERAKGIAPDSPNVIEDNTLDTEQQFIPPASKRRCVSNPKQAGYISFADVGHQRGPVCSSSKPGLVEGSQHVLDGRQTWLSQTKDSTSVGQGPNRPFCRMRKKERNRSASARVPEIENVVEVSHVNATETQAETNSPAKNTQNELVYEGEPSHHGAVPSEPTAAAICNKYSHPALSLGPAMAADGHGAETADNSAPIHDGTGARSSGNQQWLHAGVPFVAPYYAAANPYYHSGMPSVRPDLYPTYLHGSLMNNPSLIPYNMYMSQSAFGYMQQFEDSTTERQSHLHESGLERIQAASSGDSQQQREVQADARSPDGKPLYGRWNELTNTENRPMRGMVEQKQTSEVDFQGIHDNGNFESMPENVTANENGDLGVSKLDESVDYVSKLNNLAQRRKGIAFLEWSFEKVVTNGNVMWKCDLIAKRVPFKKGDQFLKKSGVETSCKKAKKYVAKMVLDLLQELNC